MKIENFDIGDKVYRIKYPNQIFTIIEKNTDGPGHFPWYTLTDGKEECVYRNSHYSVRISHLLS